MLLPAFISEAVTNKIIVVQTKTSMLHCFRINRGELKVKLEISKWNIALIFSVTTTPHQCPAIIDLFAENNISQQRKQ